MTSVEARLATSEEDAAPAASPFEIGRFHGAREDWDTLVSSDAGAGFAHLGAWANVINAVFGHETLYLAAHARDGALSGVLPLVRVRNRLLGDHLVSVPFLNEGGPVGSESARAALTSAAIGEAHALRVDTLELRLRQPVSGHFPVSDRKISVVLDLAESVDVLWRDRFTSKFRNKIKHPQRQGMHTEFGATHVNAFYEVFASNMRDHGTPVLPLAFFERIIATFPEMAMIGVTYWNDRPVAGGFGFVWRDRFEMTWSASLHRVRAQKANMLLYWDFMKRLIEGRVRRFDFGRSTPGSGPHEFKLSWGGRDVQLPWIAWPPSSEVGRRGRVMNTAARLWRLLPLPVANRVGPRIARLLPWW